MPRSYHFTRGPQRKTAEKTDNYPHLRKRSLSRDMRGQPRRSRVITKALLRAARRWDTYAARVRDNKLEWEVSRKTIEWRLIIQNGRLIKRLRWLPDSTPERWERFAPNGADSVSLPTVRPRGTARQPEPGPDPVRKSPRVPGLWVP